MSEERKHTYYKLVIIRMSYYVKYEVYDPNGIFISSSFNKDTARATVRRLNKRLECGNKILPLMYRNRDGKLQCGNCGEFKELYEFYKDRYRRGGKDSKCKECAAKKAKEKYTNGESYYERYGKKSLRKFKDAHGFNRSIVYKAKAINEIHDSYVKNIITKGLKISFSDIPQELVDVKRELIRVKRELKLKGV